MASFEAIISDLNQEKTFMHEQPTIKAEDVKVAERQRMADVFASEVSKGKEETAHMLLAKTDLSAIDIVAILQTVPTQVRSTAFEQAMAQVKNPDITPSAEEQNETPEVIAKRIASTLAKGA